MQLLTLFPTLIAALVFGIVIMLVISLVDKVELIEQWLQGVS